MEFYGARNEQSRAFHIAVYETVQQVPYGKVTSYGHIARLIGAPDNSRQVGFALKNLPRAAHESNIDPADLPEFNSSTVPWWRVINSQGKISQLVHRRHQLVKLREEIQVTDDGGVDLDRYGWFEELE
jgi:methylated-DNA-protein-cysteine methyltransferase-like protein